MVENRVSLHQQWPPSCFSGSKCGWTRWIIRSARVSLNGSLTDRRFHDAFHGESLRVALETFCFLNPQEWVIYDIYDTLKVWIKTPDSLKLFPRIALGCFFRHLKTGERPEIGIRSPQKDRLNFPSFEAISEAVSSIRVDIGRDGVQHKCLPHMEIHH